MPEPTCLGMIVSLLSIGGSCFIFASVRERDSVRIQRRLQTLDYYLNGDVHLPYVEHCGDVDPEELAEAVSVALFVHVLA